MYTIFIVEDDESIASLIAEGLSRWGFKPEICTGFEKVEAEFDKSEAQLIIMDISLPFYNGYFWCSEIRKKSRVPVIFLSSHTESMDIVMAMNMGGDDFITKPFSMEVLIAKINALLRRTYSYTEDTNALFTSRARLEVGRCMIIGEKGEAELTKNELRIMKSLLENKNHVVSRDDIMRALWDDESFIDDNTLTVNINRLRAKLEGIGLEEMIITKKGIGYAIYD